MEQFTLSDKRKNELRALVYEYGKESATPDHPYVLLSMRTLDGEVSKWWSSDEIKAAKRFLEGEMGCSVLISGRSTHVDISLKCGKWAGIESFLS